MRFAGFKSLFKQAEAPEEPIHIIAVLSDTHRKLPDSARLVCEGSYSADQVYWCARVDGNQLEEGASCQFISPGMPAERIIHAGDVGGQAIISELQTVAPVTAVLGNNDRSGSIIDSDGQVNALATRSFFGVSIAVAHFPQDITAAVFGRGALRPAVVNPVPDLIVHGHTHVPDVHPIRGTLLLCPGSTTRPRQETRASVALVAVREGALLEIALVGLVR